MEQDKGGEGGETTTPKSGYHHFSCVLPEHTGELIYSELLRKLIGFHQTLNNLKGLWREQAKFWHHLASQVHLFNLPELHDSMVPPIFESMREGNTEIREAAASCLVKILQFQYMLSKRQELI